MEGENKEELIKALHNKGKLSSLRTYQGDMAEFIKNKNESVVSIVVKEKEREEKEEKFDLKLEEKKEKNSGENFQISMTIIVLSLVLIAGGVFASFYIYSFLNRKPSAQVTEDKQIIPYNNKVTLANVTNTNLGSELFKSASQNGVSVVVVSDMNGASFLKSTDFFNFLKISPPGGLLRTLKDEYVVGILNQNNKKSYFLILTVKDFGQAFTGMLDWESSLMKDLIFLDVGGVEAGYAWRDMIVKNKDARAFSNTSNNAKMAYTFLDKDTILIVNDLSTLGEVASLYATRAVVR